MISGSADLIIRALSASKFRSWPVILEDDDQDQAAHESGTKGNHHGLLQEADQGGLDVLGEGLGGVGGVGGVGHRLPG